MMAFLYGQLEHFILDSTFHPYIYYIMSTIPQKYMANTHMTFELWLDDYFSNKYNIDDINYYSIFGIKSKQVRNIIDFVYKTIYRCYYASNKYNFGINLFIALENARKDKNNIIPNITKTFGICDMSYNDIERWNKSIELFLEIVEDINGYLYDDKELKNSILENNISYDTGLNCKIKKKILIPMK